jgi:hypothetical protein
MSTSLEMLARTGSKSGELTATFGGNLDKLSYAVDRVSGKSVGMDHFNDVMNKIFSLGMAKSNSLKEATSQINSIDEALAGMVQGGHADIAAKALTDLQNAFAAKGGDPSKLSGEMHKYQDALAATSETEKITAGSMGALGEQAMETSKALDAQRLTAQGLKDSIIDLNNTERSALDSQAGFEASIDAASKALDDNGRALHMRNGALDLSTDKARTEEAALTDLAAKTDAAAEAALNNFASMNEVNDIYDKGRTKLIDLAQAMGLSKDEARQLAEQILQTPDKTANLRLDIQDMQSKLTEAKAELAHAPDEKKVQIKAEIQDLLDNIQYAQNEINLMHGRTLPIVVSVQRGQSQLNGGDAHGGIVGAAATGGVRSNLTWVGEHGPELVRLPPGTTVHSNPDSQRMAASSGASGGPQTVQLEWVGHNAGDELMSWLRKNIRIRGGNVQTVLGP